MMITIDCAGMETKAQLHVLLAQALRFPEWYGHNLDALMDCLTDLYEIHVTLTNWDSLGAWAEPFWETFRDAEAENPDLHVTFA